jgi:hypothetical protein
MKHIARHLIVLLLSVTICFPQGSDSLRTDNITLSNAIKATVQVDKKEVPQNQTFVYTITVSWTGDLNRYEIAKLETPILSNLEIVGNSSSNWVGERQGTRLAIQNYEFILKPKELGMAYIDGPIITYRDLQTDETQRLVTNRVDVKINEPIVERDNTVFFLTVVGFVILSIIAFLGFVLNRKKRREEEDRVKVEFTPVEDKYLHEINTAVDLKSRDVVKELATLSRIFKRYLSERYKVPVLELTTKEIKVELNSLGVSERVMEQTEEILKEADVAKFAGGKVDRTVLDRAFTLVEDILKKNKTDYIEYSNK